MTEALPPARPPRRRPPWRRWLPRAAFESVLIVFSVVLALWVSDWADHRRTERRADDMRGFLVQEMQTNRASLREAYHLPHHERLKQLFYAAAGRQADPVDREATQSAMQALMASGLHPPQLRDAVWTSVSGGELLGAMEPAEVFALAEAYKAQTELEDWGDLGVETILMLLDMIQQPETAKMRLTRMVVYLEDLISQERRLIVLYDRAIAILQDRPAPAATHPATTAPVTAAAKKG